jgi:hypothetical protein
LSAGAVLFLQFFADGAVQIVVVIVAGIAFAGVYWAQVHAQQTGDAYFALAQTGLNIIAHLTAFILFSAVYGLKVRSLYSATAVGIISILLLYELLSRDAAWHQAMELPVEGRRTTIGSLAVAGGLIAGQLTWGLNSWAALSMLVGGAFLLVAFYVIHGVAAHYVDRNLTRQVMTEFAAVGAIGLAAVFASAFFT